MDERHAAESEIAQSRDRIGDLAEELSRRVSPAYVSQRAKEKVMVKSTEWKDRAVESPRLYQLAGALAGLVLGKLFFQARERRQWSQASYLGGRDLGYDRGYSGQLGTYESGGYAGTGYDTAGYDTSIGMEGDMGEGGVREKAQEVASNVKEKVSGAIGSMKERGGDLSSKARSRLSSARERIPSSYEARQRLSSTYHHTVDDRPVIALLGAIALGSIAAFLVPVTSKERSVFAPAKERVKDQLHNLSEKVEAKVSNSSEQPSSSMTSGNLESSSSDSNSSILSSSELPIH